MLLLDLDKGFFENFLYADHHDREVIHEDISGKENLLVTIGDSWTWGDSLCGISNIKKVHDHPDRLKKVYGFHLKESLNCDWINIAFPGTANKWIVDTAYRFKELSKKLNYKKIILSIGLTDMGRDFKDRKNNTTSIKEWFIQKEKDYFNIIKELENCCTVVVGRNFTSSAEENLSILDNHLDKRWVDIGFEHTKTKTIPPNEIFTIMWLNELKSSSEKETFVYDIYPNANMMINYLNESPLHFKEGTKHPNEELQKLWADYIYKYLNDNNLV